MKFGLALSVLLLTAIVGCSSEPKDPFKEWSADQKYADFVPAGAQTVASGKGILTYTAPADGTLYVVDTSTKVTIKGVEKPKVSGSGFLKKGMEIIFDPAAKRAYQKGKEGVRLTDVDPTHVYELRFEPYVDTKPR